MTAVAVPVLSDADIAVMTVAERRHAIDVYERALAADALTVEDDWAEWLPAMFPQVFVAPFADHHRDFWQWVWALSDEVKPDLAFVGIWARGGAKSSSVETACAAVGARRARRYGLYVCATQQQADDHVQNIGTLLESRRIEYAYPELGSRLVGKYGTSKGWRRNRLRTASGFTVDALGLDTSARGAKVDEDRPDLIIFDDIDSELDSPAATQKKVDEITRKLIPAGAAACAFLAMQNLVLPHGVFARLAGLADEPADFLQRRHLSGPVPALTDIAVEQHDGRTVIVAGEPTWAGQSVDVCQAQVDDMGYTAFTIEAQHDVEARAGGMFDHLDFRHCTPDEVPDLLVVEVWCDPAVTATDRSDSMGVQCDGVTSGGTIYRLRSWEQRATPVAALKIAIAFAARYGATRVGVETDQGGDTWNSVYREALAEVRDDLARIAAGEPVDGPDEYLHTIVDLDADAMQIPQLHLQQEKAGSSNLSKTARAQQMLGDYEIAGRIVHVIGTHAVLERGLRRFPRAKPFDLVDAAFWSWRALRKFGQPARSSARRAASTRIGEVVQMGGR